jgi:HNH endonuclease
MKRYTDGPDSNGCMLWLGAKTTGGYGHLRVHKQNQKAHRVAWELARGPVPEGFFICHVCDVPACVNPDHLFLGTNADNMQDCAAKGRTARGEKSGMHKLTEDQVREIRQRYSEGGVSQRTLAGAYGVSIGVINTVIHQDAWKHVA